MNIELRNKPGGHRAACAFCGDMLHTHFDRRRLLHVAAGGLAAAAFMPWNASVASSEYEGMHLTCIDPRFQEPVRKYAATRDLTGKYSQFTIAGASIGVGGAGVQGLAPDFLGQPGRLD